MAIGSKWVTEECYPSDSLDFLLVFYLFLRVLIFIGQTLIIQASPEFPFYVPLDIFLPDVRPFVVLFFSFAKTQLHFYAALFKIKGKRYKGIALLFGFPRYALDFVAVEEKLFFPVRIVVKYGRKRILRNSEGAEPNFPVYDFRPCVRERDLPVPERFYFGPQKLDTAFIGLVNGIIMTGLAVNGYYLNM